MGYGTRLLAKGLCVTLLLAVGAGRVQAYSFGAGPGAQVEFFQNNTLLVYEHNVTISSNEPNNEIEGYKISFKDEDPLPEGMYGSFVRGSDVDYLEVLDPGGAGDLRRWNQRVFLGRPGPDVTLPTAQENYACSKMWTQGIYPGGGGHVGPPVITLDVRLRYRTPQIPATSWTLTNTAAHAITDAHIKFSTDHPRYLVLPDIPAGDSITVEGQMDPEWEWTFGGMLDAPTPEPVIAFGPGGESPEGRDFTEVFTNAPYGDPDSPTCGLGAAILADRERNGWDTPDLGRIGEGRPEGEYDCAFDANSIAPVDFDLYAFSTGQKVGAGTQAEVLEDRTWDPGHNPADPTGGSGTWNTTAADWSDGTADVAWDSSIPPDAVFAGDPGTVALAEPAAARSLTFASDGYTLTGTEPLTLGYVGARVTAGNEATITGPIAGNSGLKKDGEGKLTVTGTNTYTGDTVVRGGTLAVNSDAALGNPANGVELCRDTTLETLSDLTTSRSFTTDKGSTFHVRSGTFRPLVAFTGTGPNVTVDAGGTFDSDQVPFDLATITLDHGTFTADGNGPDGGPADEPITFGNLEMTGGTLIVGTGERGTSMEGNSIKTYADETTSLVTSLSTTNPENQWLSFGRAYIADGAAAVDCDIQVPLSSGCLDMWDHGVLRLSGPSPNAVASLYMRNGTVELAKPTGVTALNGDIQFDDGTLRLLNSHQISDDAHLSVYKGSLATNGYDEALGTLTLTSTRSLFVDLGAGSTSLLQFEDSSSAGWPGYIHVLQWSGDLAGGGTEGLFFGTDATGLTADQLTRIRFHDPADLPPGVYDARILDTGEVVPLPEPATLALLALGGMGMLVRRRRRD